MLTPFTIIAVFVKQQINDTGRYVQTVKPLASNPAIQAYVADEVSQQLFERVDIKKYVKDALPRRADVLAGPLTSALQGFVRQAAERILATDQFQTLWVEANEVAHAQLVNVLTGKQSGEITATENGAVTVDLSSVTKLVQAAAGIHGDRPLLGHPGGEHRREDHDLRVEGPLQGAHRVADPEHGRVRPAVRRASGASSGRSTCRGTGAAASSAVPSRSRSVR